MPSYHGGVVEFAMILLLVGALVLLARPLLRRRQSIGKTEGPQPTPTTVDYDIWVGPAPMHPLMRKRLHYDWHWQWDTGNGDLGNQGIHQMVVDAISRTDLDLRKSLYANIVLSGGSTLTKGFGDRLLTELQRLAVKDMRIKIFAPPERKYSTWIGGSILAALSTFKKVRLMLMFTNSYSHSFYPDVGIRRGVPGRP